MTNYEMNINITTYKYICTNTLVTTYTQGYPRSIYIGKKEGSVRGYKIVIKFLVISK